ncbi:MAG: hypothetical protein HY363_01505 [Candidatus Aenigmarchaeota archaeon]|nr:hypothetical protein [Candidatus Aenigmarchaeota archaeon]
MKSPLAIAILIGLLLGTGIGSLFYSAVTTTHKTVLKTSAKIGQYVGFDLNPNELTYGTVQPGKNRERSFTVHNNYTYPVEVKVLFQGNISAYATVSQKVFVIGPRQNASVNTNIAIPTDAPDGWINGTVEILMQRKW